MSNVKHIFSKFLKTPLALIGVVMLSTTALPAHAGIWEDFSAGMANMLLSVGSAFTYVGGTVFNFSIKYGIVEFAQFGNASGVLIGWSVLRDVSNIALIFIFLAVGIATILGVQKYGAKSLLPKLIIVALLINFSLFATKFAIDTSHVLAASILNATGIQAECSTEVTTTGTGVEQVRENCDINRGLANQFLYHFNVQSIYDVDREDLERSLRGSSMILFGFLGFIFLVVVGIGLLSAAIMLLFRMGMLLILMIGSAVAFTAIILPNTEKYWNQWFTRLTKEVFVAPAMILMFAITLLFLDSVAAIMLPGGERPTFMAAIGTGQVENVSIIVMFIITLILFLLSLKIAQDFGGFGGKIANKWAIQATGGATGAIGRGTIGRAGNAIATSNTFQKYATKERKGAMGLYGSALRGVVRTSSAASKASYDLRAAPGVKKAAAGLGIKDIGKVPEGGYKKYLKNVAEETKKKTEVFTDAEAREQYGRILQNPDAITSAWQVVRNKKKTIAGVGKKTEQEAGLKRISEEFGKSIKETSKEIRDLGKSIKKTQASIERTGGLGASTPKLDARLKDQQDKRKELIAKRKDIAEEEKFAKEELKDSEGEKKDDKK